MKTLPDPSNACDVSKLVVASTDPGGSFTSSVRVLETGAPAPDDFQAPDPDAVCPPTEVPDSCVISAVNASRPAQQASVPFSFNVAAAATTVPGAQVLAQTVSFGAGGTPSAAAATLPRTGLSRSTFLLLGLGLVLIDLGYLLVSATRPGGRSQWPRRAGRR